MKRFVSFPLIITALAAVFLLPIGDVQAQTVDEVRKRAFEGLVELSSTFWKPVEESKSKDDKTVQVGAKLFFMKDGKSNYIGLISHPKSISCLNGSIPTPVFKFVLTAKGKPDREVSVSIPAPYEFNGYSPKSLIKIVTKNTSEPIIRYATQAGFTSDTGQVMVAAVVAKDGIHYEGTPLYMYALPVNRFMRDAATDLCSETNADKLLAIAKRHKLIE